MRYTLGEKKQKVQTPSAHSHNVCVCVCRVGSVVAVFWVCALYWVSVVKMSGMWVGHGTKHVLHQNPIRSTASVYSPSDGLTCQHTNKAAFTRSETDFSLPKWCFSKFTSTQKCVLLHHEYVTRMFAPPLSRMMHMQRVVWIRSTVQNVTLKRPLWMF